MFRFHLQSSDIIAGPLRELFCYWDKIRGDRKMPARRDFKPTDVPRLLPHIVMIDVEESPRRYRTRLAGSETVKAIGHDTTGVYLDDHPLMAQAIERLDWLTQNREPYLYEGLLSWSAKDYLNYYSLGLPFSSDGNQVDIIMYGMYYMFQDNGQKYPRQVQEF